MTQKPEQMPFDLGHRTGYAPEDFRVSGCNAQAFAWIQKWPDWTAPALILHGPPASGKTHLATVWREKSKAISFHPSAPLQHDTTRAFVIDDVQKFIGNREQEESLFHLYNMMKEQGGHLLLTATTPPQAWAFTLPDLKSRLCAAPAAELHAPDDELMAIVLSKMFSDRQIFVPQEVIAFILTRMERSFKAARDLVDAIDKKALAQKRPVTVPLVRELIQATGGL
jgi:DnaA regulatory inactivator Hda